jgi:hypothetical protein
MGHTTSQKEIVMSHLYRYRHVVRALAALACTLLALAASAPAAFAMRTGLEGSGQSPLPLSNGKNPTYTLTHAHTVVTGGIPGWQLAVIVIGAALLTMSIALIGHRVKAAHRDQVVPAT